MTLLRHVSAEYVLVGLNPDKAMINTVFITIEITIQETKCILQNVYIYFFFRMANNKVVPVVALARRAINDLVAFEDAVTRSVAALSTYVAEGNVERARSESRFIRGRVEADLDKFRRVLHDILQEAKKDSVDVSIFQQYVD